MYMLVLIRSVIWSVLVVSVWRERGVVLRKTPHSPTSYSWHETNPWSMRMCRRTDPEPVATLTFCLIWHGDKHLHFYIINLRWPWDLNAQQFKKTHASGQNTSKVRQQSIGKQQWGGGGVQTNHQRLYPTVSVSDSSKTSGASWTRQRKKQSNVVCSCESSWTLLLQIIMLLTVSYTLSYTVCVCVYNSFLVIVLWAEDSAGYGTRKQPK